MTTPPVRVGVGFSADTIYTVAQQAVFVQMVRGACAMFRDVAIRETGLRGQTYAVDFDVRQWNSARTMLQLQTNPDGTFNYDAACVMPDGSREGLAQNTCLDDMKAGLGWVDREDPALPSRNARWVSIWGQGGGYAGGSTQWDSGVAADGTFGLVVLGDWGPYATIFGHGSKCCIEKYGVAFCEPARPLDDLSHETGHAFGMDTHSPYIRGLDPWSDKQVADFIANNQQFIYPLEVPVPTPPLPTVVDIAIEPAAPTVRIGQTIDIDTFAVYSDGTRVNVNHLDTLRIANARIATVDSEANTLTGKRQGTTELLVTYSGGMIQKHVPVVVRKRWW